MPEAFDFAVSGINHNHIYGQVDAHARRRLPAEGLLRARGRPRRASSPRPIRRRGASPTSGRSSTTRRCCWSSAPASPATAPAMALRAMRAGKDVMVDKPGCTTAAQLAELQRGAGRDRADLVGLLFRALPADARPSPPSRLVAEGAIGRVVNTVGLGPHRIGHNPRPDWFWDTARGGAYPRRHRLAPVRAVPALHRLDGGAHPVERRGQLRHIPSRPGWNDYGHAVVASDHATGFIRVDWMTPDGLAGLGRRAAVPDGHRGQHRAPQVHGHRGPAGRRPSVPDRRQGHALHRLLGRAELDYGAAAPRRRAEPHRDRHAAGALLPRHGAGARGAPDRGAARRRPPGSAA